MYNRHRQLVWSKSGFFQFKLKISELMLTTNEDMHNSLGSCRCRKPCSCQGGTALSVWHEFFISKMSQTPLAARKRDLWSSRLETCFASTTIMSVWCFWQGMHRISKWSACVLQAPCVASTCNLIHHDPFLDPHIVANVLQLTS